MNGRGEKHFFSAELFARELDDDRQRFDDENNREKRKEKRRVGEHRGDTDHDTERH